MITIIISVMLIIASLAAIKSFKANALYKMIAQASCAGACMLLASAFIVTVPAGHNKVATMFGKVQEGAYQEGISFVNPILEFSLFDVRQKTHLEKVGVPSEDKLITNMEVSVQYRIVGSSTPEILKNTGSAESLIRVHLVPKMRSLLREQGKGVKISQDFFKEEVQIRLQSTLRDGLSEYLADKGIQVEAVLIRKVTLPKVIRTAITETKKREQEIIKQQAELERFATEQDQKVRQAESEFEAAKLEAKKIKELANAEAYRIKTEYTGRAEGISKLRIQLTDEYISYLKAQRWDGVLPVYAGGENIPMIDLRK